MATEKMDSKEITTPEAIAFAVSEVALALHVVTVAIAQDRRLNVGRLALRMQRMATRTQTDKHPATRQMLHHLAVALRRAARHRPRR